MFQSPAFKVPFGLFSRVRTRRVHGARRIPFDNRYDIARPSAVLNAMAPYPAGESVMAEVLVGIRVPELGRPYVGSNIGTLMADSGAEVVKIDPPTRTRHRASDGTSAAYRTRSYRAPRRLPS